MTEAVTSPREESISRAGLQPVGRLEAFAGGARDLAELFRALYYETARVMDATVFLFAVYDEASQTVQVVRQMDRAVEHPGGSFPLGKGFTSEVIRTGAPRLIRNWSSEGPPVRLLYGTEPEKLVAPQSGVVVPILSGNRVLGVLSAQSYQPEAYQAADLLSLGAIAARAVGAISRIRTTEQRALEHERRALQLEAILATMTDALLIVDARGAIVQLNQAARELLRLDSASLVLGQALEQQALERWPETAREIAAALTPLVDALRAGTSVAERELELAAGQPRFLAVSASVLRSAAAAPQGDSATTPLGGVIVFRDVTAQRKLERLREDIFAMAWHDMQGPIALIRGHAELLKRQIAHGEREAAALEGEAAMILKHSDRLAAMLTTLFDVSCLEAGLLCISRAPMDLAAVVRELSQGMRSLWRHRIQLRVESAVVGEWDEARIRQVLMNLLGNALKYSPEGSTVTVTAYADERAATVRVRDEGIGLEAGELARLFSRGYRAHAARGIAGEGLGLHFSRTIVAAHGGRIWAESHGRGRGSVFCFTLPLRTRA
jgi:two-component system, OmpR family, phosphate regulon sensor histidine kinase PhoR